jgi:heme A synthase
LVTSGVSGLVTVAIFAFLQPLANAPDGTQVVTTNPDLRWYSATAATGVILLTSYRLARRRQRRRGLEREPLARFFPVVAASFFGMVAVLLFVLNVSGVAVFFDPGLVVAALLILAASYAIQTARTHRRQHRRRAVVRWPAR